MRQVLIVLLMGMASIAELSAAEGNAGVDVSTDNAMADMMQLLETETEIATKSKLNADYVPGMVSVLYGDDLRALGFNFVYEAMSLIPGDSNSRNAVGEFGNSFRGVGPALGGGKILYLIDGRHVEAQFRGAGSGPSVNLAMVDRIEVIRGPGSSVYGGYAYSAVVNVILRKENTVNLTAGSHRFFTGAVMMDTGEHGDNPRVWGNVSGLTFPGSGTLSGTDMMYQLGNAANSKAPGPINNKIDHAKAAAGVAWKGLEFGLNFSRSNSKDFFGLNNTLSTPANAGYFIFNYANYYLDHTWETDTQEVKLKLGRNELRYYSYTPVLSAGFTTIAALPVVGATIVRYPDGMIQQLHYTEQKNSVELEWHKDLGASHRLLASASAAQTQTRDAWYLTNYDLATKLPYNAGLFIATGQTTPIGWQRHSGANNWMKEGVRRTEQAAVLQDEWQYSDAFTLTSGVRFDHFSDAGSKFSPRLAGVYAFNEKHIFKTQFATAFRPPTFLELYLSPTLGVNKGNIKLKPETSNNLDVSYIYKDPALTLRTTVFYSKMNSLITLDTTKTYSNIGKASRKGVEFEYNWIPFHHLKWEGNISYIVPRDETSKRDLVSSTRWISNSQLSYQVTHDIKFGVLSQYVGKRARGATDPRPAAASTVLWDASLRWSNAAVEGLTATLGVKNMFNKAQVYPSPMAVHPATGAPIMTYPGDYPQEARRGWMELKYSM